MNVNLAINKWSPIFRQYENKKLVDLICIYCEYSQSILKIDDLGKHTDVVIARIEELVSNSWTPVNVFINEITNEINYKVEDGPYIFNRDLSEDVIIKIFGEEFNTYLKSLNIYE